MPDLTINSNQSGPVLRPPSAGEPMEQFATITRINLVHDSVAALFSLCLSLSLSGFLGKTPASVADDPIRYS